MCTPRIVAPVIAGFCLLATTVSAQTIENYPLKVCTQGQSCVAPVTAYTIPATEVTCGQAKVPPPSGTVTNPRFVRWDDPAAPTLDCVWDSGATSGPLFALPFSSSLTYDAVIQASNTAGSSPESARSNPFSRPGVPPAARTGLRIVGS